MVNKRYIAALKRNFTKVPLRIWNMGLPANAVAIYLVMAGVSETFNPSIRFLANKLKISCSTVVRNIKIMESRNLIKKIARGGLRTPNVYAFLPPKDWRID